MQLYIYIYIGLSKDKIYFNILLYYGVYILCVYSNKLGLYIRKHHKKI